MRLEVVVCDHDGLAEQKTVFRAADVKCVAVFSEIRDIEVVSFGNQRRRHSRAVQEKIESVLAAHIMERGELRFCVDRAELGCVRDIDHARQHHVLVLAVTVDAHDLAHERRCELAVGGLDRADLVPGGFNCAGLVDVDMPRRRGDHALPRAKGSRNDDGIGERAAYDEVNVRVRAGRELADGVRRLLTKRVHAVAAGRFKIVFADGLQNGRMRALGIIIAERNHDDLSFFSRFCRYILKVPPSKVNPTAEGSAAASGGLLPEPCP